MVTDNMAVIASMDNAPALAAPFTADRNPALVYLASLPSQTSRKTMLDALNKVAGMVSGGQHDATTFPWTGLRYQHTQAIRAQLAGQYKPATVNKILSAVRGTLEQAWLLDQMTAQDYLKAARIKSVRDSKDADSNTETGRALNYGEVNALISVCCDDPSPAGIRDAALLSLMYATGLRRAEVVALDVADYHPEATSCRIEVRHGKGNRYRDVPIEDGGTRRALAMWLDVRGRQDGPLFCRVNKGGALFPKHRISRQAVYNLLQKRADEAGIEHLSPHDMRRTFASHLLEHGKDLNAVRMLLGHKSVSTTQRYDKRGPKAKRLAVDALHAPFKGWRGAQAV